MKKLMSAIIASVMAVSALIPVFAADTFKDVNSEHYAYSYVEDMVERGLITGYEDGTYRPGNSVSRMEAFALFARLMGSNSEANADLLDAAKKKYADVLEKYNLSYAEGDVAFMLLRGVLSEDELDTYFAGTKKTEAMPRYEAAILITKAMLGEDDAKKEVLVDMDYTDVSTIPKSAKQYVYYVTQNDIMHGMGNGEFSANTDVLRGQIAVMLSKTADTVNYTFESITITKIEQKSKNITIKDADGKEFKIGYDDDARFYQEGELVSPAQITGENKAVLTYVSDGNGAKLAFADVVKNAVDETKSVIFKSYTKNNGKIEITVSDQSGNKTETYVLKESAVITSDGEEVKISDLKAGYNITIGISGDEVAEISTMQKSTKINAAIEKTGISGTVTISSEDEEYDGKTFALAEDAVIVKNNDVSKFSDLGRGDKGTITLEYGVITRLNMTSLKRTITGALKEYTISSTAPKITINCEGEDKTFDVPANIEITLNGEKVQLSALKLGSSIAVTVESEVVKKIDATGSASTSSDDQITGTVVGAYDKTIIIQNSDNGGDVQITVSTTNMTKIVTLPSLSDYTIKNIKNGDTITAYGGYENSVFVAATIMVTPATK